MRPGDSGVAAGRVSSPAADAAAVRAGKSRNKAEHAVDGATGAHGIPASVHALLGGQEGIVDLLVAHGAPRPADPRS